MRADVFSRRQRRVLEIMARRPDDDEGEIVMEGRRAYLGDEPISPRTVWALVRLCAISTDDVGSLGGGMTRWRINGTGRKLLAGDLSDLRALLLRKFLGATEKSEPRIIGSSSRSSV